MALLFGRAFWQRLINFDHLVDTGMIAARDLELFHFVETAEQAWETLAAHYGTDVEDVGTRIKLVPGMAYRAADIRPRAVTRERVRCEIDDTHDEWAIER